MVIHLAFMRMIFSCIRTFYICLAMKIPKCASCYYRWFICLISPSFCVVYKFKANTLITTLLVIGLLCTIHSFPNPKCFQFTLGFLVHVSSLVA